MYGKLNNAPERSELHEAFVNVPVHLGHHAGDLLPELVVCVALVDGQPQAASVLAQL